MGMREAEMIRLANATRLRIALQVIAAVVPDGTIGADDLLEVIERVGEMVRESER